MKIEILGYILLLFILIGCKSNHKGNIPNTNDSSEKFQSSKQKLDTLGNDIQSRFPVPDDYERTPYPNHSFQQYLRTLPLKPADALVRHYNGTVKPNRRIYTAVVDLKIGNKDLHQCADAVMRLRAEYLWKQKRYQDIHFNFTNGFRVDYTKWMQGYRMNIHDNKTNWVKKQNASNTYEDFWNYMELIFMYAGTASLDKELSHIQYKKASIGDIIIQGGFPGHAVIIVDKAIHKETGKAIYLLAQSYMPAQELQVLHGADQSIRTSWYDFERNELINTPEWTFNKSDFKRFHHYKE